MSGLEDKQENADIAVTTEQQLENNANENENTGIDACRLINNTTKSR